MKAILSLLLLFPLFGMAQQVADPDFEYPVNDPSYAEGEGPLILIDGAHNNFHTLEGRYAAFANLLAADGFRLESLTTAISEQSLSAAKVLVISNPIHESDIGNWVLPNPSAFKTEEITVIEAWVREGGRLFLIADHMPFGGGAGDLARAFGFEFGNGFARNPDVQGWDLFTKANGGLLNHEISENIEQVASFTGQAFTIPTKAEGLIRFPKGYISLRPDTAWQFNANTPRIDIEGQYQGAVMVHGQGKIAVFGEAAMFTTQLAGARQIKVGMNARAAKQNAPFLINLMRWLNR